MLFNIHFTKALVLAGLLALVGIFTFNKIIQQNRLEVFKNYSNLILPPDYEIKQNTAGAGNYRTDVLLVFQFDKKNYDQFIHGNNIKVQAEARQNNWINHGSSLTRQRNIAPKTIVVETIYPNHQRLVFRFQQE